MKKILLALSMLLCSTTAYARDYHLLGLKTDVGVPDGIGISATIRPLKYLQGELGGTYTLVGGGIRVGATVFVPYYVSPSFTLEYGYNWFGDMNDLVVKLGGSNPNNSLLRDIQYGYVNFQPGLSFGHPNWFLFGIHAGMSYITGTTHGLQAFVQEKNKDSSLTLQEVSAGIWIPTAKIVFQFYF